MANNIGYARAYMEMLDGIYKANSTTAILETADNQYRWSTQSANSVYIRTHSADGMGTYSRSGGYVAGDNDIAWVAYTFAQDRGRKYNLDTMDAQEAKTTVMELMAEIQRVNIVPEIDAYRFSKICSLCSLDASVNLTVDTAINALDTGIQVLDDAESPIDSRVLFVSNEMYKLMKGSGEFFNIRIAQDMNSKINRTIETFDGMPLIRVPSARFKSAFTFYDGTTGGQEAGGFVPNPGKDLNFMIVPTSSVIAIMKHMSPKLIAPELNASADGWVFGYRVYHDLFIPDNKLTGVYIHSKA